MNFVDRFPLATILDWADENQIDLHAWKTWGDVAPEFVSSVAMHRLHEILQEKLPDQPLGLLLGSRCTLDTLGLFGQIGQHCSTLRQAAETYARYQRLSPVPGQTRVEFDPNTGDGTIVIPPDREPGLAQSLEFRLSFAVAQTLSIFRQMLALPDMHVEQVAFGHNDKRFRAQYETFLGGQVLFGCKETRITFASEIFDSPVSGAVPGTRVFLEEFALTQLKRHAAANATNEDFVEVLRTELRVSIPAGTFDGATIARKLSVSLRTMQRRLAEQSFDFSTLVEEVRAELALEYLARPELTVHEIAAMLGYTQASSFHRAFKRWTGHTPAAARRDLLP